MNYLLSTRVYFSFAAHKLANILSNHGKVNSEVLVHFFRYIRYNKTLVLHYYAGIKYLSLSDLLIQSSINTKNQLMAFSDSSWQDCPDTGRSTGSYIIFYQGVTIDHGTYVTGPVTQSISESEYNSACTAGMDLAHFWVLLHELLNKDPDIFLD